MDAPHVLFSYFPSHPVSVCLSKSWSHKLNNAWKILIFTSDCIFMQRPLLNYAHGTLLDNLHIWSVIRSHTTLAIPGNNGLFFITTYPKLVGNLNPYLTFWIPKQLLLIPISHMVAPVYFLFMAKEQFFLAFTNFEVHKDSISISNAYLW